MNRARAITGGQAFVPLQIAGSTAALDLDFRTGNYVGISGLSAFSVTRTGPSSSGLPEDATGSSYIAYPANTARIVSGSGLLVEETKTQYLGVTDAPATQTTASLGTGSYTLWVIGTGSATPSAGTATITGAAAATAGSPNTFTVTVSGTVVVTVSGSLTRFQLENGSTTTSYIPNHAAAGSTAVRGEETVQLNSTNFSSWFNASTGTFFAEWLQRNSGGGAQGRIYEVSDNTTNNVHQMTFNSVYINQVVSGGVVQANINGSAPAFGTIVRGAAAYALNDYRFVLNGTAGTPDTGGSLPVSPDRIVFGNRNAVSPNRGMNGFLRRLSYSSSVATTVQMQGLTS